MKHAPYDQSINTTVDGYGPKLHVIVDLSWLSSFQAHGKNMILKIKRASKDFEFSNQIRRFVFKPGKIYSHNVACRKNMHKVTCMLL